jgi:hypothetical protein
MKIQISRNEMRILGYLHEHAKGFDDRFMFQPNALIASLGITSEDLSRDTSFLAEHNLVKLQVRRVISIASGFQIHGLNLTGEGENMMRNLEAEMEDQLLKSPDHKPGLGAKLTVKTAEFLWDSAKGVVIMKVTQWLSGQP